VGFEVKEEDDNEEEDEEDEEDGVDGGGGLFNTKGFIFMYIVSISEGNQFICSGT